MRHRRKILAAEIGREVENLGRLRDELRPLLPQDEAEPAGVVKRATGSILHDFYGSLERIFRLIGEELDEDLPHGDGWHVELLRRMSMEIADLRPAVISAELAGELEEYLRFRHVFRNVYGFELRWSKFAHLAKGLDGLYGRIRAELDGFGRFLADSNR